MDTVGATDPRPVETELKLLVDDRAALESVLALLGPEIAPRIQDNLYFDTVDGSWGRLGYAVRLRAEGDRRRLTVKTRGEAAGAFVARGEWETDVDGATAERLRDGGSVLRDAVVRLLADHGADLPDDLRATDLVPRGSMHNVRRRATLPGAEGLVVELDETTYPNGDVRHEVELEVPDVGVTPAAARALREVFDRAGVAWRPSQVTKRERLERVLRGESA